MGNWCNCVCKQTNEDEASNALLNGFEDGGNRPRGPPPPYQVAAPLYAMTEEQRVQLVQRVTMIQCLPLGRYDNTGGDKKDKNMKLEECGEVQGSEKKGEKDRECPICMMDFAVGEHIRLLPCMHFYHMRCIDDWLMRSYSCPTCMQRVDIGMRNTLITSSSSSSSQGGLRRRRRRRRESGSTSSAASVTSASGSSAPQQHQHQHHHHHGTGAEGYSKRTEEMESQYHPQPPPLVPQGGEQVMVEEVEELEEEHTSLGLGIHLEASAEDVISQLSRQTSGQYYYSGQSVSTSHGEDGEDGEEASCGRSYEASGYHHQVQLLNDSGFEVQQDEVVRRTNHNMTIGGFHASAQGIEYSSPPTSSPTSGPVYGHGSSDIGIATSISPNMLSRPFSPPAIEYHFEYPSSSSNSSAAASHYN